MSKADLITMFPDFVQTEKYRNYVSKTRKFVYTERRPVTASFKRGISVVRRPMSVKPSARDLMKRPAPPGKVVKKVLKKTAADSSEKKTTDVINTLLKSNPVPPSVEPTEDGHYELNPLLSKMLDVELQDVMTKIWNLSSVNPQDAADKIAIERLGRASESLKNVLGLNVTKRLLNVHNPLYVKMVFSGKPARADLVAFLKQYNVSAFKRVGERGGTFAAKMRSFQDFDLFCTSRNLKCGNISVSVTPCYQFKTCPSNLRTRYDGKTSAGVATTTQPTVSQINKPPEKQPEPQNTVVEKVTPKVQNITKVAPKPTQTIQKQLPKEAPKVETKQIETKPAIKVTPNVENKPVVTTTELKPAVKPQNTPAKVTPAKMTPAKVTPAKVTPVKETPAKVTPAKVTPAKVSPVIDTPAKVTPAKPVAAQNPVVPKTTPKPAAQNPAVPNTTPKPANVANTKQNITKASPSTVQKTPTQNAVAKAPAKQIQNTPNTSKTTPKPAPPTKVATPKAKVAVAKPTPTKIVGNNPKMVPKAKVSPKKKQNDFDELSDRDILALISEGIVLDECSGSDVE